ncbi:NAD(P)/FAD-dependent oxidoreductase [Paraburkholderia oxyphila]|uniref:NAD(P)/FAD-dependent oxidoreductase n=1 Tax=Paraburkholderia oxyphila TaxID=614212 RepID=UPI0005BB6DC1|nr:FAD-dependent oxidoreductase [Paraburkholderia oxyphila]
MQNPIKSTNRRVVIVGGGLAALRCTEELRRGGHDGRIAIVTAEPHLPYDRPPLSKDVLLGKKELGDVLYRDDAFYREHQVDMYLSRRATGLRIREREVLTNGSAIAFDDLLICTGASPRPFPLKSDLEGIYTLGRVEDALRLRAALQNGAPRVVILGAGFIGAEVASAARSLGLETTIVNLAATPLERAVGPEMGGMLSALHADHGARLLCSVSIEEIFGQGRVEELLLTNGERIPCDILVIGIGSAPNIGWLEGSGLELANGIVCDATLSAGPPGIYAAGDVAWWPNGLFGRGMRCEQWTNAAEQGRHVARNMLAGHEGRTPFVGSNYFWSDQYGHRIQFAGSEVADEVKIVKGAFENRRFLAYYRKGDQLCGALALNEPKALMLAKQQIETGTRWDLALEAMGHGVPWSAATT